MTILQKYMVHLKFCKTIHLSPWHTAVGAASSGHLAWDRHSVVSHSVRNKRCGLQCYVVAPWATAAAGRLASWATTLEFGCLYNTEIRTKNVIIIRKKEGRGEGSEEEVVKVRSSAGFSSR
jgi:hypothetical protein